MLVLAVYDNYLWSPLGALTAHRRIHCVQREQYKSMCWAPPSGDCRRQNINLLMVVPYGITDGEIQLWFMTNQLLDRKGPTYGSCTGASAVHLWLL